MIRYKKLHPDAKVPVRATPGSGCYDIFAVEDDRIGYSMGPVKIRTGLAFEIPPGKCMVIYSRSSVFLNGDVLMTPTVIDSDYRGEVFILMRPMCASFHIKKGDRIAQFKIENAPTELFEEVEELLPTERGAGGLGSTGR